MPMFNFPAVEDKREDVSLTGTKLASAQITVNCARGQSEK